VIPNITRGQRVHGLLIYLWGPGRREEHTDPHLVAAWDGTGELADLEPALGGGRHDVRRLAELLDIPVRAGRNPPRKPVWQCSVRTHPNDPIMTDQQWRDIARQVVAKVGLAPDGDEKGVRWIAMRHVADHIHIVATWVRQDRRTYWARNDYPLAQAACRDVEADHNLVRVAPPGQGTRSWPKAGELNKHARRGRRITARDELRRRVRDAATVTVDEDEFFTCIHTTGRSTYGCGRASVTRARSPAMPCIWPATPPPTVSRSSTAGGGCRCAGQRGLLAAASRASRVTFRLAEPL
jgi:MobA/VirD2-like, nuclease domain